MPLYELTLVIRPLVKSETVACLKRVANLIWKENGVLKEIEYLGQKKLPFAIPREDGTKIYEGSYFLYHVSLHRDKFSAIKPEFKLDIDLLRHSFCPANESKIKDDYECTLEEELLPPVFRKSVRPLLEDKNVIAEVRR